MDLPAVTIFIYRIKSNIVILNHPRPNPYYITCTLHMSKSLKKHVQAMSEICPTCSPSSAPNLRLIMKRACFKASLEGILEL